MKNISSSSRDWLTAVQSRLGYQFADPALLELALTHRSASRSGQPHNERLEFLGDAVLGQCVAEHLYRKLETAPESEMTLKRSTLVRRETLATLARELKLGEVLQLGAGERRNGVADNDSVLSDAFEALVGAVYLDGGHSAAARFVAFAMGARFEALGSLATKDAKTRLQEWMQGQGLPLPEYRVIGTEGALHAQTFRVACELKSLDQRSEGEGSSRREAEKAAAAVLLEQLDD